MKLKRRTLIALIVGVFFSHCSNLFAVKDEEIQKIRSAMPDKPVVQPEKNRTMLVFSLCNGFKHSCIPYWKQALDIMSEKTGAFKVVHSEDMAIFTEAALKPFDAICFNNTTGLVPDEQQQQAIMQFIRSGKGIVGIHAATDNFKQWPEGMEMMGGVFKGHPWGGGGTWAIKIDDPDHPLMTSFKGQGFKIKDEIYRTAPPLYSRDKQRVLMSLDMSDPTTKNAKGVTPEDMDTGISWIKSIEKGRLFYCSLGHNHHLTWTQPVLEHYLAGIQYAFGDLKVDDRPLGNSSTQANEADTLIEDLKGYDWTKSRASLVQLNNLIKEQNTNPTALKEIELKLVNTLNLDMSLAAKDFVCRQLAMIGTDLSVQALLKMLDAPETANLGRYALERIPSPVVDQGLLAKLNTVSDTDTKIGIITSLGIRKCDDAVETIVGMVAGGDPGIVDAAIQALGYNGSRKSAEALKKLPQSEKTQNALLCCADSLREQGQIPDALAIYRGLYAADNPSVIRAGALIGLIQMEAAGRDLQEAIVGSDPVVQAAAAQQVAVVKDAALLQRLASQLSTFPDHVKIQLIASFAANEKKIGRAQVEQIVSQTDSKDVRIAAFAALGALGDESTAERLAGYAAKASDRDEKEKAREALYRLSGKDVDAAILEKIASASSDSDEAVIAELIRATAERMTPSACGVLLKIARSTNPKLSSEAVGALQSLAGPGQMKDLVDLLVEMPGSAVEDAVIVVGRKIEDQNKRAQALLAKYGGVPNEASKVSMLHVLGKLGDKNSVGLIKKEFSSRNQMIQNAAFRAMTDWPASDFIEEMKTLSLSDSDDKTKILAFRTYIRMVEASGNRNQQQKVDELIAAYPMARRPEEQKIVIGALSHYGSIQALDFVGEKLEDSTLKAEAEAGLIQICEKLLTQQPSSAKPVLQKLKNTTTNESIKKKAEQLLKNIV